MHQLFINGRGITGMWDALYARYLKEILQYGETFVGRNGETRAVFGASITADLRYGFPLTRLRKMPFKNIMREFLFDIGFSQNVDALGPAHHFWDFLADEDGELGASAYNRQWRMWPPSADGWQVPNEELQLHRPFDQFENVIDKLRRFVNTRQATIITHNPTAINPACPPCHLGLQFMPSPDGWLDVMVPARSNDMVVGFPLDIARYATILTVIARTCGMDPRFVYMPSANSHVYQNCYDIAIEMIDRDVKPECQLSLSDQWEHDLNFPLDYLQLEHLEIENYDPHPTIKIAVN